RVRSAAHYCAHHALRATGRQSEQPPLPPRHPQRPPDGGHVVEPSYSAIQLARPSHGDNCTAAYGASRNDRPYDLINIDHPTAFYGRNLRRKQWSVIVNPEALTSRSTLARKLHTPCSPNCQSRVGMVAHLAAFQRGGLVRLPHGSGVLDQMATGLSTPRDLAMVEQLGNGENGAQ